MSESVESETKAEPRSADHHGRRSWVWPLAGLVLLGAAGAGGRYVWMHRHQAAARPASARRADPEPSPSARVVPGKAVKVSVVTPEKGGLPHQSVMVGSVHPYEFANLFAKVSGFLKVQSIEQDGKTVPVDIGLRVKKDELLAVIDAPEIIAEAEKATADVQQARSQAAQAQAALVTAKADLEASKAAVKQAEAEVGRFKAHRMETYKAYQRFLGLRGLKAVDQDVVDQREDAYESAQAEEVAAQAAVITAQAKVTAAEARVIQMEADLRAAQANISVTEANLRKAQAFVVYTKITSPYTGVITARNFHIGDFIRSATEGETKPLLTVARTDLMRVVTKIPDPQVPYADVGDPAIVEVDSLPGVKLKGTVARFTEAEDPMERMMRTEIDLPNDENSPAKGRLREGMYGLATITLGSPIEAFTIPSSCVTARDEKDHARVLVARNGRAHEVQVRTGVDNGVRVEILSGLDAKDRVIIPTGAVGDGSPVQPIETQTAQNLVGADK